MINLVDANGVLCAAVKALANELEEREEGIQRLEQALIDKEWLMTNAERLRLERARAAVQNGDSATLRESSKQLEDAVFDQGRFSDDTARELSETIKSDAYARLTDGVLLIKIFEYNLGLMTESQVEEFGSALISFVPRACDETAAFLAIELLAELWTDRRSVDAIRAVKDASVSETTLALVAHGFHWLAKKSMVIGVKELAIEELEALRRHPSSDVSGEAVAALHRISRIS